MSQTQSFQPMDVSDSGDGNKPSTRVAYFYDPDVGNYNYALGHPMKPHRIRMAHNLIVNYGLCDEEPTIEHDGARSLNGVNGGMRNGDESEEKWEQAVATGGRGKGMQVFRPKRADRSAMTKFHSDEYVDFLQAVTPETCDALSGGGVRCLTGEDCPAFEGLFEFCSISAGGSLGAAERLNSGQADIAINWAGGLHHAKKTEASGFCYINDIVLGILELLRIHPRVLYIDVDVHHGDGVEEAFYTTDRVMTASFHRFGEFFPGTGDVRDVGMKRGKGYAVNVPLRDGITNDSFHTIFKPIIQHIIDFYRPGAIVLQMGADSLAGDKLGGFNVSLQGHAECARFVKSFNIPVMMLGGGGYTTKNVARAWTYETAVMCDRKLSEDLPYNQYMEYYGPRFKLEVLENNMDNHNEPLYLEKIKNQVLENLRNLPHAPGVQMKEVPSTRIATALGLDKGDLSDPEDDIDIRIRKIMKARRANNYGSSGESSESESERPQKKRQPLRRPPPKSKVVDDGCSIRKKRTFFATGPAELAYMPNDRGKVALNGKEKVTVGLGLNGWDIATMVSSLPNAFVTLLTSSSYLPGALVLLHSLLALHPAPRAFKTVCLVTPETVDVKTIAELRRAGWDLVIGVEGIASGSSGQGGLDMMSRPDLNLALTKLHLFRLSSLFSTLIYLDADVLPLRPLVHLFSTTAPHVFSACADTGWPDCFNSGVMVIRPRESDWEGLRALLKNEEEETDAEAGTSKGNGSFDGADQGLLNEWFSEEGGGGEWNRLSFTYNVTPSAAYTYQPAYRRYGHKINAVHFIGSGKPWVGLANRPAGMSIPKGKEESFDYPSLVDRWYAVYDKHVRPTAAHAPDLAARFAVPQSQAVWDRLSASAGPPQQPEDRMNLETLKAAALVGMTSFTSGQYLSLPLEGRIDLMMPKPKPKAKSPSPPLTPNIAQSPTTIIAPLPQTWQQQSQQPATWDGSRHSPPKQGQPEMIQPMNAHYAPAWDAPKNSHSHYHQSHPSQPEYPTLPSQVTGNDWYGRFTGSVPSRQNLTAVFPWEENGQQRPVPGRVFPRGDTPPPVGQRRGHLKQPSITIQAASPEYEDPPRQPSPPKGMSQSMASYKNAWDQDPKIRKYVTRLAGAVGGTTDLAGSITRTRESSGDRSERSEDGDDEEGDTEEDDDLSPTSPFIPGKEKVLSGSGGTTPTERSVRYRDRPAQTEVQATNDAKVQARPGGGPSPAVRSVDLPTLTSRSSSETGPTPPSSDHGIDHSVSGVGNGGRKAAGRVWDASTDVEVRKRDTQEVLSRFLKAGTFAKPSPPPAGAEKQV